MKGNVASLEMTVIEPSVALSLRTGGGTTPERLAAQLEAWFGVPVPRRHVARTLETMARRGWIGTAVGAGPGAALTPAGVEIAHGAFKGLVRQIDGGRGLWQVGLMWTLAGTGGADETRH